MEPANELLRARHALWTIRYRWRSRWERLLFITIGLGLTIFPAYKFGRLVKPELLNAYLSVWGLTGTIFLLHWKFVVSRGLRVVAASCPYCDAHIAGDQPWTCEHCDRTVLDPKIHSIFGDCPNCGKKPWHIKCKKCNEVLFFDEKSSENYKRAMNVILRGPEADRPFAKLSLSVQNRKPSKPANHVAEVEALEHQIKLEKLKRDLEEIKQPRRQLEQESGSSKGKNKIEAGIERRAEIREFGRKAKAKVALRLCDEQDKDELAREYARIDQEVLRLLDEE